MSKKTLLNRMLPSSIDENKVINIINDILEPYIDQNFQIFTPGLFLYANIDKLDETLLNHLAYECHVDFYDVDLPIEKKRELVKNSIKFHRYKGTPYAVEEFLSTIFDDVWIKEWFEYGGKPYYFKIYTRDNLSSKKSFKNFMKALYTVKNTRSWLESFTLVRDQKIYYGLYGQKSKRVSALPYKPDDKDEYMSAYVGMAVTHKSVSRKAKMPEVWTTNDYNMFLKLQGEEGDLKYGN